MTTLLDSIQAFFSVWHTVRGAGLTAYILLFLAVSAGLVQSLPVTPPRIRPFLMATHTTAGWLGLLFGLVHGLVLRFDNYIGYSWADIFIPFSSAHKSIATSAGIIGFYVMLVIMASSDWRKYVNRKIWRLLHMMAYPAYLLALYHGLVLGTDTQLASIRLLYVCTSVIAIALFIIRLVVSIRPLSFSRPVVDNRKKPHGMKEG